MVVKAACSWSAMTPDPEHHRRSIRIPAFDYAGPGAYFITIVTQGRACLFGHIQDAQTKLSMPGRIAEACWQAIPEHFPNVELGTHVVMPNHLHGIIVLHNQETTPSSPVGAQHAGAPAETPLGGAAPLRTERGLTFRPNVKPGSLGAIVRSYKSAVTRAVVRALGGSPPIWQRNYYEHVIRDEQDWNRIHLYIQSNIVNWAQDAENPLNG